MPFAAVPVTDAPGSPSPVADAPGSPVPAQRPTRTVLIPVYNEERTVATLLQRVADGPYPDKEVIVIDDGSRDATPQLLEAWAGRPGFVLLRHDRNRATCYKAEATGLWRELDLRAERFELCPEMTAKSCRWGVRIVEVSIAYHPRGASAGKKIGWRDAV